MTKGNDQRARPMLLGEEMLLSDLSAHSTLCASSMGTKPSAEDMMSAVDDCITPAVPFVLRRTLGVAFADCVAG